MRTGVGHPCKFGKRHDTIYSLLQRKFLSPPPTPLIPPARTSCIYLPIYLSIYLFIYLSIYLSYIYLSIYLQLITEDIMAYVKITIPPLLVQDLLHFTIPFSSGAEVSRTCSYNAVNLLDYNWASNRVCRLLSK